jgi:hypothetical protein
MATRERVTDTEFSLLVTARLHQHGWPHDASVAFAAVGSGDVQLWSPPADRGPEQLRAEALQIARELLDDFEPDSAGDIAELVDWRG